MIVRWSPTRRNLELTVRKKCTLGRSFRPSCSLCTARRFHSSEHPVRSISLSQTIQEAIKTTGPISIANYMRQCLTSSAGGYYTTSRSNEQIGRKGDFVTSPEITQVFGELVGIWFVSQWMAQGRPAKGVELIELGPGKGTLMDDILRTIRNFRAMSSSIESVYMIEASKGLRLQQHQLLCGQGAQLDEVEFGWRARSKYRDIPITWAEELKHVPNDTSKIPFIVAHEFFDALPIHAFQSIPPSTKESSTIQGLHGPIKLSQAAQSAQEPQWRELLVAAADTPTSISTSSRPSLAKMPKQREDFQLTLAKASTPTSLLLPESSARYRVLKQQPGAVIEISPESQSHAVEIARRIGGENVGVQKTPGPVNAQKVKPKPSGAALMIDYGTTNTVPTSTLRGIQAHKRVSPFISPGEVDLSVDVDFTALAEAAIDASEGVEVHGPMEQGEWLQRMGISERAKALCDKAAAEKDTAETIQRIESSVKRLTERGGGAMGKVYKVMAIVPESGGQRPVGFGGSVPQS